MLNIKKFLALAAYPAMALCISFCELQVGVERVSCIPLSEEGSNSTQLAVLNITSSVQLSLNGSVRLFETQDFTNPATQNYNVQQTLGFLTTVYNTSTGFFDAANYTLYRQTAPATSGTNNAHQFATPGPNGVELACDQSISIRTFEGIPCLF